MKVGVYSFEDGKEPKDLNKQIKVLKKQLKIAVEVLDFISTFTIIPDENTMEQVSTVYRVSSNALNQIEELDK